MGIKMYFCFCNFLLSLLFSAHSFAESSRGIAGAYDNVRTKAASERYQNGQMQSSRIQAMVPSTSEGLKYQIIRQLVGSDTPSMTWPPFPRLWLERAETDFYTSNTAFGINIPVLKMGPSGKLSIEFRYALKTSLIVISSKRKKSDPVEMNQSVSPATQEEEFQMLRYDAKRHITYPNVREEFPMVAMCVFEASLAIESLGQTQVDLLTFSQSVGKGKIKSGTHSTFSNFIQLDPNLPINYYLNDVCGQYFRNEVERSLINDFSNTVSEIVIANNPKSECKPDYDSEIDNTKGDASCADWHNKNYTSLIQKLTIPRCELQVNGAHKCVLKARENTMCPMYSDPRTQKYSEVYDPGSTSVKATDSNFEFECDKKQGLSCEMQKEPTTLAGPISRLKIPFFKGEAKCVRKK